MEQEDEEFEKLLGEIPHATCGRSQLEGLDPALPNATDEMPSQRAAEQMSQLLDTEVYGDIFQVFQAPGELEPCGEQQVPPYYPGIVLSSANEDVSNGPTNMHQSKVHQLAQQKRESSLPSASRESELIAGAQQSPSDSLTAAFGNLEIDVEGCSQHAMQENGDDRMISDGFAATSEVVGASIGLFDESGVTVGVPVSPNSGTKPTVSARGFRSILPGNSIMSWHSSSTSQLRPISNGHSAHKPLRPNLCRSNCGVGCVDACANGGTVDVFVNGSGLNAKTMGSTLDSYGNSASPHACANGKGPNHWVDAHPNGGGSSVHLNSQGFEPYMNNRSLHADSPVVKGLDAHANGIISNAHSYGGVDADRRCLLYGTGIANQLPALPVSFQSLHSLPQEVGTATAFASPTPSVEHELSRDAGVVSFLKAQQLHKAQLAWQRKEDERQMMQRILLSHSLPSGCMQNHLGPPPDMVKHNYALPSFCAGGEQLYKPYCFGSRMTPTEWGLHFGHCSAEHIGYPESVSQSENYCTFFAQGFCRRGESCPFIHSQSRTSRAFQLSPAICCKDSSVTTGSAHEDKRACAPVKILSRMRKGPRAVSTLFTPCEDLKNGVSSNGHTHANPNQSYSENVDQHFREAVTDPLREDASLSAEGLQPQLKYSSMAEVEGRIFLIAKDQHGCRFLQRKFDEGGPEDVLKIFLEIIDHIIELMTDPFGNYLIQKLLEVCTEDQRLDILTAVTSKGELINISLNMHGTRAVQKLIETLTSREQVSMVITSLSSGVVTLIKDLNGNHVIQRCLQCLGNDDSQFIFEAAASHCVEIATHRHGCCVLQRCIDFSTGIQRQRLVSEIAENSLVLSQDPFGNYVVQYILELGIAWASVEVMDRLAKSYASLSMQKFSSNVVEKCLKYAGEDKRTHIIHELINSSRLAQLLQDPYANYVIQSALSVSKGVLHASLVEAIRPHIPSLRSSPYGKRILSRKMLR